MFSVPLKQYITQFLMQIRPNILKSFKNSNYLIVDFAVALQRSRYERTLKPSQDSDFDYNCSFIDLRLLLYSISLYAVDTSLTRFSAALPYRANTDLSPMIV